MAIHHNSIRWIIFELLYGIPIFQILITQENLRILKMKCHYEVMELEITATADDIKRQYKKLALKYHPDRNLGDEVAAGEAFKLLSSAYAVLSDPHERQWYDDHRDSILRGGDGTNEGTDDNDDDLFLWKFFNSSCYSDFTDHEPDGFYYVYENVFLKLWEREKAGSVGQRKCQLSPSFGNDSTPAAEVITMSSKMHKINNIHAGSTLLYVLVKLLYIFVVLMEG